MYVPGSSVNTGSMTRKNPLSVPMMSVTKLIFNRLML